MRNRQTLISLCLTLIVTACLPGFSPGLARACQGEEFADVFNPLGSRVDIYAVSNAPQTLSTAQGSSVESFYLGSVPSGHSTIPLSSMNGKGRYVRFEARISGALASGVTVSRYCVASF